MVTYIDHEVEAGTVVAISLHMWHFADTSVEI
jgi:hypothetical protein